MLKNCILPVLNESFLDRTCGEIVYQNENSFIIICKFCQMKIFQFDEFVEHFLLIHRPNIREASNTCTTAKHIDQKDNVKTECNAEDDEYEIYNLDDPITFDSVKTENKYHPEEPIKENNKNGLSVTSEEEEADSSDMYEPLAILRKKLTLSKKTKETPYNCTTCSRSFTKKCYLDMHEKHKHKVLRFQCKECNRSFTQKCYLNVHEKQMHQIQQFQCTECNRSFATELLLKQHQFKHTGYPCEECGKAFKHKDSLRYHMDTHKVEKDLWHCDFENCGKAFMNKRRLYAHKSVHSLKFVCEICGSRQSNKHSLTDHIRTHTGEKPYVCKLCDHRFTSRNLLCEHQACHETERKHICDVCGKSFNRQKALYHHKHLHLGIKKFVCQICGAAYAQAAGLSAHRRKHKENINNA